MYEDDGRVAGQPAAGGHDRRPTGRFALRQASFKGDGLVAGASLRDWEAIRDLSYSERGA